MYCLTAEEIFAVDDRPREFVEVPEWRAGAGVYVRTMGGDERDAFEAFMLARRTDDRESNLIGVRKHLVALCAVKEDGSRVFSDTQVDQIGQRSAKALDRIFAVAQRINGLLKSDVEELTKNSPAGPSAGNGSASA